MVRSKVRKNKELSFIAILTVGSQILVGQNHNKNIAEEVAKLQSEFSDLRLERERLFVKKNDLYALTNKLDHVNEKIGRLNERVAHIDGFLKKATSQYNLSKIPGPKMCIDTTSFFISIPSQYDVGARPLRPVVSMQPW